MKLLIFNEYGTFEWQKKIMIGDKKWQRAHEQKLKKNVISSF